MFLVGFVQVSLHLGEIVLLLFCTLPLGEGPEEVLDTQTFPLEPKTRRAVPPGGSFISAALPPPPTCRRAAPGTVSSPSPGSRRSPVGGWLLGFLLLSPTSSASCKQEAVSRGQGPGDRWGWNFQDWASAASTLKGTQRRPAFWAGLCWAALARSCEKGEAQRGQKMCSQPNGPMALPARRGAWGPCAGRRRRGGQGGELCCWVQRPPGSRLSSAPCRLGLAVPGFLTWVCGEGN